MSQKEVCSDESRSNRYAFRKHAYAMKKHHATRLHYDLRLEWNGVLLSWALPKDLNCHAGVSQQAIEMEDHNKEYLYFEGVHATGPIMLWDCGTWEPHPDSVDIESSLRKGILRFSLHGEKLKGGWTLTRTSTTQNAQLVWMLCKNADAFAETPICKSVFEKRPNSIKTGRGMEEIVRDWTRPKGNDLSQMRLFDEA